MKKIICLAVSKPSWQVNALNSYSGIKLYVVDSARYSYQNDAAWSKFDKIYSITEELSVAPEISVEASEAKAVAYTQLPKATDAEAITWESSDEGVATVSSAGVITGVAPGTATITASTTDGSRLVASSQVTVNESAGISTAPMQELSNMQYYQLDGQKVAGQPQRPGLYIRVSGNSAKKIIIR